MDTPGKDSGKRLSKFRKLGSAALTTLCGICIAVACSKEQVSTQVGSSTQPGTEAFEDRGDGDSGEFNLTGEQTTSRAAAAPTPFTSTQKLDYVCEEKFEWAPKEMGNYGYYDEGISMPLFCYPEGTLVKIGTLPKGSIYETNQSTHDNEDPKMWARWHYSTIAESACQLEGKNHLVYTRYYARRTTCKPNFCAPYHGGSIHTPSKEITLFSSKRVHCSYPYQPPQKKNIKPAHVACPANYATVKKPPSDMRFSEAGKNWKKRAEAFEPNIYNDMTNAWGKNPDGSIKYPKEKGHCTIGWGHLIHYGLCTTIPRPADTAEKGSLRKETEPQEFLDAYPKGISEARANQIFEQDVKSRETFVRKAFKTPLTQAQFDALVDFTFHSGEGNVAASKIISQINAGKFSEAQNTILTWTPKGEPMSAGELKRRTSQLDRFNGKCN